MKFGFLCEDAAKYDLEYEISPLAPFPSRHLNLITSWKRSLERRTKDEKNHIDKCVKSKQHKQRSKGRQQA